MFKILKKRGIVKNTFFPLIKNTKVVSNFWGAVQVSGLFCFLKKR